MSPLRHLSRPAVAAPAAAGVVLLLLLAVVSAGLRLPGIGFLDAIGEEAPGYSTIRGQRFSPLTDPFIEEALGPISAPGVARSYSRGRTDQGPLSTLEHALTNDAFADALVVPGVPFTAVTDTRRASREPDEPSACSATGGTVWYRFTPKRDVLLSANTFGTSRAMAVGVYTGRSLSALARLGCDTDLSGAAEVVFLAKAGTAYSFQLTGLVDGGRQTFSVAHRGRTLMASATGRGPGNGDSGAGRQNTSRAVISADGRFVAFPSFASNLVPRDANGRIDVFVRNLQTGTIARASVTSSEEEWTDDGSPPGQPPAATPQRAMTSVSISADGRYVAFNSFARDLVPGDTNGEASQTRQTGAGEDTFVRDMVTGTTTRVSVSSSGRQGVRRADGDPRYRVLLGCCAGTAISADGRYVAFTSWWEDLVPSDTNEQPDVFVHDRRTGRTTLVSIAPGGAQMWTATQPFMSADGRYVGFGGIPPSGGYQVFVRDMHRAKTVLASFTRRGTAPNGISSRGSISEDGRFVVFGSSASDIVPGDTNGMVDVFRADLQTRTVARVSVDSRGRQQEAPQGNENQTSNFASSPEPEPQASGDGRFVTFGSPAANLVPGDTNGLWDVFVHDTVTGATWRVSVGTHGDEGNNYSGIPSISRTGRYVAFSSLATNLVAGDDNGTSDVFVREVSDGDRT